MGKLIDMTAKLQEKQEHLLKNIDSILEESYDQAFNERQVEYDKAKGKIDKLVRDLEKDMKKDAKRDLVVGLVLSGIVVVICFGVAGLANR